MTPADDAVDKELPARGIDLQDRFYVLLRRRWLILGVFLAIASYTTVRTMLARNVYQASVQVLIERDAPQVLDFKGVDRSEPGWGDDFYQTQYKLLQSRALARRTIESLNLLADPEFGGPRTPQEIQAILAQPAGQSAVMEGTIDGFLGRLKVTPVKNSRLVRS